MSEYRTVEPDPAAAKIYEELYRHYRELYFAFGRADVLPALRRISTEARSAYAQPHP